MHDQSAGKIKASHRLKPAPSPYPVSQGIVDNKRPEYKKSKVGFEGHSLGYCAAYQCWSDYGKHSLKHDECVCRDCVLERIDVCPHEHELAEVTDKPVPGGKRK